MLEMFLDFVILIIKHPVFSGIFCGRVDKLKCIFCGRVDKLKSRHLKKTGDINQKFHQWVIF